MIIAVLGIPGALAGGLLVELPKFGRRGALAVRSFLACYRCLSDRALRCQLSSLESFCLLRLLPRHRMRYWGGTVHITCDSLCSTRKSHVSDGLRSTSNIMYAVLYAYTASLFPALSLSAFQLSSSLKSSPPKTAAPEPASPRRPTESSESCRPSSPVRPPHASHHSHGSHSLSTVFADLNTPVPVYVSGALFILAGVLVLLLPYEPRGKASI